MSVIDHKNLLDDLSEHAPCGSDLEYDVAFVELEQAVRGKAEQQVGDIVTPAEEPDWPDVRRRGLELCACTHDLRVWLHLARALLHTNGLSGLHDALQLILGGVEHHWNQLHPQLDPDDGDDPTLRVNVLMSLCDAETMLRDVRHTPLVVSPVLGRFSLRDIDIAEGRLTAADNGDEIQKATIDAAFRDAEADALRATLEAAEGSLQCLQSLERFVTEQVGVGAAPSFPPLADLLREITHVVQQQLALHHDDETIPAEQVDAESLTTTGTGTPAQTDSRGGIRSREDVIRVLDEVCEYLGRHEPSSPVPILLKRAKRLVHKDFMAILRDLAPDGVSQAEMIMGFDETVESDEAEN